jgi:hypothetical protein
MITLKLTDPIVKIDKDIRNALVSKLNKLLFKNQGALVDRMRSEIEDWIMVQPEIVSLLNRGIPYSLHSLFGLRYGKEKDIVKILVSAVANSTRVSFTKLDSNFRGGLTFYIQPSDFQNLLGLPEGHILTGNGSDLHWLDWLLTKGDSVVVSGYRYDPTGGRGRSGGGIMIGGGYFRVSPQFSGTISDNFVTRALENKEKEISLIMSEAFK